VPPGLSASARRLWAAVAVPYVLTPVELAMLEEACHTRTELDRLEKAVRALPDLVVSGSMGQPRMHPLLNELRLHRALLAKLTEQLNLPDEDQQVGLRGGSRRAQHAARARWDGRGTAAS
jgi:hypothetical protein